MLIAVNRGRGQQAVPPPRPSSPLPMFCPWKRVIGGVSHTSICSLWGTFVSLKGGGHQGSEKGTRGQGVLSTAPYGPPGLVPNITRATRPLGTLGCPCAWSTTVPYLVGRGQKGWAQMYGADPSSSHRRRGLGPKARLPLERPKPPCSVPAPLHLSPPREWAELGGQECHKEEGDAHCQGQVFLLGAGPADALLKLGHLGVLSLKVFCG